MTFLGFLVDLGCSGAMRLLTLGFAYVDGRAVLWLLLACAPLPDAVTNDASISGTTMRGATIAL
jgi:hypothetical protein